MIFLDRERNGADGLLDWKVRLFLLGAALAMVGIGLDSTILVALAIVILVAGALLRFLPGKEDGGEGAGHAEADEPPEADEVAGAGKKEVP